jgi:hypothetical protein
MKKTFLIAMILLLNSCSSSFLSMTSFKVPDGTPLFQEGWRDGCSTQLGVRSTSFYRMKYAGYKRNPDYIDNPEYNFGYSKGYSYCFNYIVGGAYFGQGGSDSYIYGKGTQFDMTRGNWNNTVNYETGTWNNPIAGEGGSTTINGIWDEFQQPKSFTLFGSHPIYGTPNSTQIFGW